MEAQVRAAARRRGAAADEPRRARASCSRGRRCRPPPSTTSRPSSSRATAERQALEQNLQALRRGARPQEIETALHRLSAAESRGAARGGTPAAPRRCAPTAPARCSRSTSSRARSSAAGVAGRDARRHRPPLRRRVRARRATLGGIRVGAPARVRVDARAAAARRARRARRRAAPSSRRATCSASASAPTWWCACACASTIPSSVLHAGVPAFVTPRPRDGAAPWTAATTASRSSSDRAPVAPLRRAGRGARRLAHGRRAARSSACSARTAPASRRPSACCAASSTRPAAAARVVGFDIATRGRARSRSASAT